MSSSTPDLPTALPSTTVAAVPDPRPSGLAVLDVREPEEYAAGHIDGAVHVPLGALGARTSEVPAGQVIVVCKAGGRSARATAYLLQQGHEVVNLQGGMLDWEAAGRPMVSETGAPPRVV